MNSPQSTEASTSPSRTTASGEYGTSALVRWIALAGLLVVILIGAAVELLWMLTR